MNAIRFSVPGDAVSFQTKNTVFYRNGKQVRGTRKTDAAADWEAEVRRAAAEAWSGREILGGPVEVVWTAIFALPRSRWRKRTPRPRAWKTTKPDLDKIKRLIFDAMEGVVFANDAQVVRAPGQKLWGAQGERARTIIAVRALDPLAPH